MCIEYEINPNVLLWLFFLPLQKNKNVTYYVYKRYFKKKRINTK